MTNLKGNIADAILKEDRQEESKEKADFKKVPKVTKGSMEDIKEQDSEQESVQVKRESAPSVNATLADNV